jgi:hypothetical protein
MSATYDSIFLPACSTAPAGRPRRGYREAALVGFSFTERQARFLVAVMLQRLR